MWISKKRLEQIKKDFYSAGLDKGYELGSQPGSRRLNRLAHMAAVEEAERMLRNGK